MNRKLFVRSLAAGAFGLGLIKKNKVFGQTNPLPPVLAAEKVKEFVSACHKDLDKVKLLLAETPNLIYASWDLGGGDFESGIEAAGHVGRKDIANYLLEKGARSNIFLLTMFGQTAWMKAYLQMYPDHLTMRGPHGLSLLHHANKGGEEARELAEHLQSLGLKEIKFNLYS
jgi:hypothetical protein